MSKSKIVSISLPADMVARIDAIAAVKYKSHNGKPNRSKLILDAIATHFKVLELNKISNLSSPFDTLRDAEIQQRTAEIGERYRVLCERAASEPPLVEERIAGRERSRVEGSQPPLDAIDSSLDAVESSLDAVESSLEAIDASLEAIDPIAVEGSQPDFEAVNQRTVEVDQPHLNTENQFPGKSLHSQAYQFTGKPLESAKSDPVIIAWLRLFPGLEAEIDNGHVVGITGTDNGYRLTVTTDLNPAIEKGLRWLGITLDIHKET